jgi:hypothetical protein
MTTATLICALDNKLATSANKVSTATSRSREWAMAAMSLTRKGAVARASAAATGTLSTLALRVGFGMKGLSRVGLPNRRRRPVRRLFLAQQTCPEGAARHMARRLV